MLASNLDAAATDIRSLFLNSYILKEHEQENIKNHAISLASTNPIFDCEESFETYRITLKSVPSAKKC